MNTQPPSSPEDKKYRQLRIVTIFSFIPAMALNIPAGIVTALPLPALGLIPMAMSSGLGVAVLLGRRRPRKPHADLLVSCALLLLLLLTWIFLPARRITANKAMLCAYATMPMIVNLIIHTYIALKLLRSFIRDGLFAPRACPNCNHAMPSVLPKWRGRGKHITLPADDVENNKKNTNNNNNNNNSVTSNPHAHPVFNVSAQTGGGSGEEVRQSLMRGYDEDARESSEFQTSGFNTPRPSGETLRSEVRSSGETMGGRGSGEGSDGKSLV